MKESKKEKTRRENFDKQYREITKLAIKRDFQQMGVRQILMPTYEIIGKSRPWLHKARRKKVKFKKYGK